MSKSAVLWQTVYRTLKYVPLHEFDYTVHISLKNNFLYVETPKVACSTLKLTLARLELEDSQYDREDIHSRHTSPLLRPSQVGDFEKFLKREGLLKFCFVRNPYERVLSGYLDKVCGRSNTIRQSLLLQLGRDQTDPNQEIAFDEFVGTIEETPVSMMNSHWRIQYFQTFQETIPYDFVGKIEQFEDDVRKIGNRLSEKFQEYYRSWNVHQTGSRNVIADYYTPELRERVYNLYEIDFETFGYERDLPI